MAEERQLDAEGNPVELVVKRASRFSKEFVATVIALVSTAFGVVVALAWNAAIQAWFARIFDNPGDEVPALFVYAIIITLIGVLAIVYLGRLATRLGAQPVEFKYPAPPKG